MVTRPHVYLAQWRHRLTPTYAGYAPTYVERLHALRWALRVEASRPTRMTPCAGQHIKEWL